jgi:hypothetical protein
MKYKVSATWRLERSAISYVLHDPGPDLHPLREPRTSVFFIEHGSAIVIIQP